MSKNNGSDDNGESDDYEVGFGRPPRSTQFQKGKSGNPSGRPKGSENIRTIVVEEMNRRVEIIEGGKKKNISAQRALIRKQFQRAMAGSDRAAEKLLSMVEKYTKPEEQEVMQEFNHEEVEIIQALKKRLQKKPAGGGTIVRKLKPQGGDSK